jgi:hypothetical protein
MISELTPPPRTNIFTRGVKLGDRNVLVRIYRERPEAADNAETAVPSPSDPALHVAAFDPLAQRTYEVRLGPASPTDLSHS